MCTRMNNLGGYTIIPYTPQDDVEVHGSHGSGITYYRRVHRSQRVNAEGSESSRAHNLKFHICVLCSPLLSGPEA